VAKEVELRLLGPGVDAEGMAGAGVPGPASSDDAKVGPTGSSSANIAWRKEQRNPVNDNAPSAATHWTSLAHNHLL
jgi:hypothetical protein